MTHYRMKAACSSPTPRTDKAAFWTKNESGDPKQEVVDSEVSRKLESELSSLAAKHAGWRRSMLGYLVSTESFRKDIASGAIGKTQLALWGIGTIESQGEMRLSLIEDSVKA